MKEYDTSSGAALADTDQAETPAVTFDNLALDLILTSETNPRQTFDTAKLQELAASIGATGVMQPILVRPLPAQRLADSALATDASQLLLNDWPHKQKRMPRPAYEIISGERRYRASILAGKATIPAMIRRMADAEVLEAQLVENLQRDDLHPMEEAEGYRRLCETTGIKKEDVGAKIGKSRTYVYQRLHLLVLGQEARDAFRAGKIDASKALLLSGVADPKLQLKALKEVTEEGYGGQTKTVRQFRDWLEQNVMLKLDHAPFDIKDATLNEEAGACGECPKRTGVNRDIFEAFDSPDMCTDPKCYGAKATISLQRIKDAAAEKGMTVIAGVEAKKAKPYSHGDEIKGYTRLDEKLESGGTVGKALGKDAPTPMLFVDPHTQKQIKVLPTAVVGELLKEKGITVAKGEQRDHAAQRVKDEAKRQARLVYENAWRGRAAAAVNRAIQGGAITSFTAPILRQLCTLLTTTMDFDNKGAMLPLWGLPAEPGEDYAALRANGEAVDRHVQAAPDTELGRMALTLMMADELEAHPYNPDTSTASIEVLAGETGVDLAEIQREVKAEQKAAAAAAKKPAKTPAATPLAAQAQGESEGSKPAAAGGKKARSKAAKLSAEDAQQGIADAMQGIDPASGGDLAGLEGMTPELVQLLAQEDVTTLDDLANCTIDEIAALSGWSTGKARTLIMKAREKWFAS